MQYSPSRGRARTWSQSVGARARCQREHTVCHFAQYSVLPSPHRSRSLVPAHARSITTVESSSSSTIAAAIERQSGRRIHLFGKLGLRLNGFPACDGSDLGSIARSTHAR